MKNKNKKKNKKKKKKLPMIPKILLNFNFSSTACETLTIFSRPPDNSKLVSINLGEAIRIMGGWLGKSEGNNNSKTMSLGCILELLSLILE